MISARNIGPFCFISIRRSTTRFCVHGEDYQRKLTQSGFGEITTEVTPFSQYFYAEEYHQQYLAKNPTGYCGVDGTGVTCDIAAPVLD